MAVAFHGPIRLLLASFCSFVERSRLDRADPKHYPTKAYGFYQSFLHRPLSHPRNCHFGVKVHFESLVGGFVIAPVAFR